MGGFGSGKVLFRESDRMVTEKIVSKDSFREIRERLRAEKKTIVLCHGVFDLLHYGHLEHILDAKKQGDILVGRFPFSANGRDSFSPLSPGSPLD